MACVGLAAAAAPALASVSFSTDPALEPPFHRGASDYVVRCVAGKPVAVTVHVSGGAQAAVAGGGEHSGDFVAHVRRATGAAFTVRARSSGGSTTIYHVRCLPLDFPDWTIERPGKPRVGWLVTTPDKPPHSGYVAIFDAHGAPVWWHTSPASGTMPWDAKVLADGLVAWTQNYGSPFGVHAGASYQERTLDGQVVRSLHTIGSPTDTHDFERMSNGHLLEITYRRRDGVDLSPYGGPSNTRVFYGEIQELLPSGQLAWDWSSRGHVSPAEAGRKWWYNPNDPHQPPAASRGYDLLHTNSVEPDATGVVVSARHLDAVFHVDRASGRVDWKLGGSYVPGESLTVLGAPAGQPLFGGQHDARVWTDGTLTVFDNRAETSGRPAADRFQIDPVKRTARLIEHVTEPDVTKAQWGGSARKLPGGDWVVDWGGTPLVTEQTPAGKVLLALRFGGGYVSYRAQPLAPGALSAAELRSGMDSMASP